VVGTAQYLSPEQAQGFEVTAASDVYSLGVVAYECLTGGRPFDGTSQVAVALAHINRPPPPLPAEVPRAVRELIERALAKDPAERFADGAEFAAAIRAVASAGSSAAAVVPPASGAATEVIAVPEGATSVIGATGAAAAVAGGPGTASRPMPPLQRPEDQDPYATWDDEQQPPNRRWIWVAAIVLAVLLLGGVGWLLLSGGDDPGTTSGGTTSATATGTTSAGTVAIDTDSFIGEDFDTVRTQLEGAGLKVSRAEATDAQLAALDRGLDPDTVAASDPANTTVPVGSAVTLYVASDGFTPDDGSEQTTQPRQTTASSTSSATTTTATTTTDTTTTSTTTTTTDSSTAGGSSASDSSSPAEGAPVPGGDAAGAPGGTG